MNITLIAIFVAVLSLIGSIIFGIITIGSKKDDKSMENCIRHKAEFQKKFDTVWGKITEHDKKLEDQIRIDIVLQDVCKKIDKIMEKLEII